ncbi:cytochrome d ubiquinol oxidase subunit II [Bradyrhizobium sp. HKCCYLS1011]|uniref:cytochrome d ubiquinol oxidase subunit II n=1 Tax=Bradyrhizobium sp. HKCCYLS1011 TaxID=3420733 RepID=UPI003EB6FB9F
MIMVWIAVLALSIVTYVLLDGVDLGIGILMGLTPNEGWRQRMFNAVGPLWDGNEAWLIVAGAVLWGAFPIVFSTLISAFQLPISLMLACLIVRRVACGCRFKIEAARSICDASYCCSSLVAAFMQGAMVGGLVEGLPLSSSGYVGGAFGWISPFAAVCGIGLCFGYSLLGAAWIFYKSEGGLRDQARQFVEYSAGGLLAFFTFLFLYAFVGDIRVMSRWLDHTYLLAIPATGPVASFLLSATMHYRRDDLALYAGMMIFAVGFATLAISFWPYMIPFSITIDEGAAAPARLAAMSWLGVFALPLLALYTVTSHSVFRGVGRRRRARSSSEKSQDTERGCSLFAVCIPLFQISAGGARHRTGEQTKVYDGEVAHTGTNGAPDGARRVSATSDC